MKKEFPDRLKGKCNPRCWRSRSQRCRCKCKGEHHGQGVYGRKTTMDEFTPPAPDPGRGQLK